MGGMIGEGKLEGVIEDEGGVGEFALGRRLKEGELEGGDGGGGGEGGCRKGRWGWGGRGRGGWGEGVEIGEL